MSHNKVINYMLASPLFPHINWNSDERLMFGVLAQAIEDVRKAAEKEVSDFGAKEWFEEEESEYLYSFHRICEYLNLNPEYVIKRGISNFDACEYNSFVVGASKRHNVSTRHYSSPRGRAFKNTLVAERRL